MCCAFLNAQHIETCQLGLGNCDTQSATWKDVCILSYVSCSGFGRYFLSTLWAPKLQLSIAEMAHLF